MQKKFGSECVITARINDKMGFLWMGLNSAAAAIISSLIRTMTKLVPDIKPDNRGKTPMVYLFSQLMTLEVAFLSPYVSCSTSAKPKGSGLGTVCIHSLRFGKAVVALPELQPLM